MPIFCLGFHCMERPLVAASSSRKTLPACSWVLLQWHFLKSVWKIAADLCGVQYKQKFEIRGVLYLVYISVALRKFHRTELVEYFQCHFHEFSVKVFPQKGECHLMKCFCFTLHQIVFNNCAPSQWAECRIFSMTSRLHRNLGLATHLHYLKSTSGLEDYIDLLSGKNFCSFWIWVWVIVGTVRLPKIYVVSCRSLLNACMNLKYLGICKYIKKQQ